MSGEGDGRDGGVVLGPVCLPAGVGGSPRPEADPRRENREGPAQSAPDEEVCSCFVLFVVVV